MRLNTIKTIRIGTRRSTLARWQAAQVAAGLIRGGYPVETVIIDADGDLNTSKPIYAFGVEGIFTRTLDVALLDGRIDVAVHSYKDVPLSPAKGLGLAAVLERGAWQDVVAGPIYQHLHQQQTDWVIATCSVRRKAQWAFRYPNTRFEDLRGTMETRMQKLRSQPWDGAIFAQAGLERIDLLPADAVVLPWMLPAPAQGAIAAFTRLSDDISTAACQPLHHHPTGICVAAERSFLHTMLGGCHTPIAALAQIDDAGNLLLEGQVTLPDGSKQWHKNYQCSADGMEQAGAMLAKQLLEEHADLANVILNGDIHG